MHQSSRVGGGADERDNTKQPRAMLLTAVLAMLAAISLITSSPVSAEIDTGPTTDWGVTGLAAGSQTDTILSSVFAIEQIGDRIYMGGRFTQVTNGNDSFARPYLAAFDATTGAWLASFNPVLDAPVLSLQASPDGSRLFVGGAFNTVNGLGAESFVALDPTTGATDQSFGGELTSATVVRDMDVLDGWIYVTGSINGVTSSTGNNTAYRAVRFDWQTGAHDPNWRPVVQGGSIWGVAASSTADRVYLAGEFLTVDGVAVTGGFAAVTKSGGTLVPPSEPFPVNTTAVNRQYLYDVETVNGLIFAGGSEHFVAVLAESDQSLLRFHHSYSKGDYQDLEVVGNRVYAGCHCRASAMIDSSDDVLWFSAPPPGVSNGVVDTTNDNTWITAFDATTGEVDPSFHPNVTALRAGVWAIHGAPDGCLWFGGDLTGANGTAVDNVVRMCDGATLDTERPSVPGKPKVDGQSADSVDLSWNPSTDDVGVTGYLIYDDDTETLVATTTTTSTTIGGLAPGTHRYYARATDAAGNISYRSGTETVEIAATTDNQRPSTPGKPRVTDQGADFVDLEWNPSTDNVGVTGYQLFDADTNLVVATTTDPSTTLVPLSAGTYRYYTKAFDAAGNISYRSGIETVVINGTSDNERPSPPTGLVVLGTGPGSVDLGWNPSTDNVGVDGYNVYDNSTGQVVATVAVDDTTLTGLDPGTHTFYVKAFDAAGNLSYRSNLRTVTIN